jgi:hypothetical protein
MKAAGLALLLSWSFCIRRLRQLQVDRSDDFTAVSPLAP